MILIYLNSFVKLGKYLFAECSTHPILELVIIFTKPFSNDFFNNL